MLTHVIAFVACYSASLSLGNVLQAHSKDNRFLKSEHAAHRLEFAQQMVKAKVFRDSPGPIDTFRAELCFSRLPMLAHSDCMDWLVKDCNGKYKGSGLCKDVNDHCKHHCQHGDENACDYARKLGMDPSGWERYAKDGSVIPAKQDKTDDNAVDDNGATAGADAHSGAGSGASGGQGGSAHESVSHRHDHGNAADGAQGSGGGAGSEGGTPSSHSSSAHGDTGNDVHGRGGSHDEEGGAGKREGSSGQAGDSAGAGAHSHGTGSTDGSNHGHAGADKGGRAEKQAIRDDGGSHVEGGGAHKPEENGVSPLGASSLAFLAAAAVAVALA